MCVHTDAQNPEHQEPEVATIVLRSDQLALFRRIREDLTSDAELARQMEISHAQLSRVLNHDRPIGTRFVAGLMKVFGADMFSQLFLVIPDDKDTAA